MHNRLVSRRIDALHQCFLIYIPVTSILMSNANCLHRDQILRYVASDLGLHCLPYSHIWVVRPLTKVNLVLRILFHGSSPCSLRKKHAYTNI